MFDATLVTIMVAALGLLGVVAGHTLARLHRLEDELDEHRRFNRNLWVYTRRLLDLYYRHRAPDAPDPDPLPEEK